MGTFIEEQKVVNVQINQRINTMESSLNQKLDGLQSDLDQKIDILQYSFSRLTNQQHVQSEEENPEEECLIETTVEEHCKQQNEAISPLLTKEGNGKEVVEEPQKPILKSLPLGSLPAAPSPDPMHTLPKPTTHGTPKAKANSSILLVQNFRKLVATVQTCATTSKKLVAAHTVWHNGWFRCWFKCGVPGPQHF